MRIFFGLVGLVLTGLGGWIFVAEGSSAFFSGWGLVCLALGLASLLSLTTVGLVFTALGAAIVFFTGIGRIFLGMGDWWLWLLTSLGMFVIMVMLSTQLPDDENQGNDQNQGNRLPSQPDTKVGAGSENAPIPGSQSTPDTSVPAAPVEDRARKPLTRLSIPSARQVMSGIGRPQPKASTASATRACASCGATTTSSGKFCGACGSSLD